MDTNHFDPAQFGMLFGLIAMIGLLFSVVMTIPYWFIFKKAGFTPWLSLLMFVPLAGIVVLYVVAFSEWKVIPVAGLAPGYPPSYPPQQFPPQSYPPQG